MTERLSERDKLIKRLRTECKLEPMEAQDVSLFILADRAWIVEPAVTYKEMVHKMFGISGWVGVDLAFRRVVDEIIKRAGGE